MKVNMDKESLSLLRRIGLNEYESKAYLSLINKGIATASEVSDHSGIPRPRAYDILENLSKKGFVSEQPGRPVRFKSVEITEAFDALKKQKSAEMTKELSEMDKISQKLKAKIKETPAEEQDTPVWVIKNRENIHSKIESLINNANQSVLIATSDEGLQRKLEVHEDALRAAQKRGVEITIVTPNETQHTKKAGEFANVIKKKHDQRMVIADDHVLLFLTADSDDKKETGAWIHSPYFADNQRKLMQKC